jgi:iron only hydrogenase large subunit-like protein
LFPSVFSGCVTSAEAVLIEKQSYSKVIEILSASKLIVIFCIAPQSIASLADLFQLSLSEMFLRLAAVLKKLGVRYVFDSSCAGDVALMESQLEFLHR